MKDIDIAARHVVLGTEYGGWPVCLEVMRGPLTVYSFGIGTDISWDLGVLGGFEATVDAYDPTPVSMTWVARQNSLPAGFRFHPVGLSDAGGMLRLAPPTREGHASYHVQADNAGADGCDMIEVPVSTLSDLMAKNRHRHVDILKMDIEGSEYAVIEALANTTLRPTQILVEFHHDMYGFAINHTRQALRRLQAMGYRRFHRSRSGREQGFVLLERLHESRTSDRGVAYFAFGEAALNEANLSVESLRSSNPGLPSAVFTDLPDRARHDIVHRFSPQEEHDIRHFFIETKRMPSIKVRFLMSSPFDRTAVLDADTYVKGDISEMFDVLDDHDLALTNMPEIEQVVVEGKDRPVHAALKALTRPGALSCAVFSFRKSPAMVALAQAWWTRFVESTAGDMRHTGNWGAVGGGINEQAILQHMMKDGTFGRCGVQRTILPNTRFNAGMTMWLRLRREGLWEDCRILHSHLIRQQVGKVGVDGLPDLPNLQKFA